MLLRSFIFTPGNSPTILGQSDFFRYISKSDIIKTPVSYDKQMYYNFSFPKLNPD